VHGLERRNNLMYEYPASRRREALSMMATKDYTPNVCGVERLRTLNGEAAEFSLMFACLVCVARALSSQRGNMEIYSPARHDLFYPYFTL
jgi:hypothetical protein